MQTDKQEYFLKAKKSLGQHFLRSEIALEQMVGTIPLLTKEGLWEVVFEIGPGEGVLTEKLLEKGFTVIVIEIDARSIEILQKKFEKFTESGKLYIINKDCLEVDYAEELKSLLTGKHPQPLLKQEGSSASKYVLLGNIPYYITGAIFRNTFEQKTLPTIATFLIQKEVAQRIVARDGKESILSISVKIFSDEVSIVDIVKAGSFVPPPKVDSAILTIQNILNPFENKSTQEIFFQILRASFSHKRKFLLTNLKTDLDTNLFDKYFSAIEKIILKENSEKARAEDLKLETWKKIIKII